MSDSKCREQNAAKKKRSRANRSPTRCAEERRQHARHHQERRHNANQRATKVSDSTPQQNAEQNTANRQRSRSNRTASHTVEDQHENTRQRQEERQHLTQRQQCEREQLAMNNTELSHDEALALMAAEDPKDQKFSDFEKSPAKAMLLSYCNHGFMSFDQWKEYCVRLAGDGDESHFEPRYKELDVVKLAKEIADEAPTDAEFGAMIKQFTDSHSMTEGKLLACGACGIRQMEHKHPDVQYKPAKLTDPIMDLLKYSHDAAVDLHHKLQCKVTVVVDEQGTLAEICPWRVISFYEPPCSVQQSAEDVTYFHLHPELVSCCHDEPYTYLCPTCLDKLKHGTVPPMSIAAGVDFGHFR
jgi:hypothetical protein